MDRSNRRTVLLVVVVMALALSGCQYVKAGARCKNGVAPGRDKVNVLYCVKGHWKKWMSVAQANKLAATIPIRIEAYGDASPSVQVGTGDGSLRPRANVAVKVFAFNGAPLSGAKVHWSVEAAANGAGANVFDISVTGRDGLAASPVIPNTTAGVYTVIARVEGIKDPLRLRVTNTALSPVSLYRQSGDQHAGPGQAFPRARVKLVDRYGNPVPGFTVTLADPAGFVDIDGFAVSDGDGMVTINAKAGFDAGAGTVYLKAGFAEIGIGFVIDPGPLDSFLYVGGDQSASLNTAFANPVEVAAVDEFGNVIAGVPVSFSVIDGVSGASGTVATPSTSTDVDGIASTTVTANGIAGAFTLRITMPGVGTADLTMTNN